jgi:hypothetical protein
MLTIIDVCYIATIHKSNMTSLMNRICKYNIFVILEDFRAEEPRTSENIAMEHTQGTYNYIYPIISTRISHSACVQTLD